MKRKIIAILCFTLMIAALALFSGCGGGSGGGSGDLSNISPLPSPSVDCGGESCIE